MTKRYDSYFDDVYAVVGSAVYKMITSQKTMEKFGYLNDKETFLLKQATHLMYKKLVEIGNDSEKYNFFKKA